VEIRSATREDIPAIVAFTTDTFAWGDYVPEAIGEWIDDPDAMTMVAVMDGEPVAVARTVLLTPTEAWGHGVRVRPDLRGHGVAGELTNALLEWTGQMGAQVVRLLIEDDNAASICHVDKVGLRRTVRLLRATRAVGEATANPQGNGVKRGPSAIRAKRGNVRDVPLVMASWNASDIGRAMRGLVGFGWRFHTLRAADIEEAAHTASLWEVGSSWAITSATAPTFDVAMLDTRREDGYEAVRALIDTANNGGAELVSIWIPPIDWLVQAVRRAGCDLSPMSIWEYAFS